MLDVKNITKYYRKQKGVANFSLQAKSGECIGIIGINGSGKTTFFKVLLNLLNRDTGTMHYQGKDLSTYNNTILGYLPEERCLYLDLTVYKQVQLLGRLKEMSDQKIEERLDKYLKLLKIVDYKYTIIGKLSKGNQQKVQIICSLIHDPKIVVLDEPLSGLDIINVNILKKLIYQLKRENKIILMASHQFEHIEQFCEHIIILKHGDTQFKGSLNELQSLSKRFYLALDQSVSKKYHDKINYSQITHNELTTTYELNDYEESLELVKEIMNNNDVTSISLKPSSIEQIVREFNLI